MCGVQLSFSSPLTHVIRLLLPHLPGTIQSRPRGSQGGVHCHRRQHISAPPSKVRGKECHHHVLARAHREAKGPPGQRVGDGDVSLRDPRTSTALCSPRHHPTPSLRLRSSRHRHPHLRSILFSPPPDTLTAFSPLTTNTLTSLCIALPDTNTLTHCALRCPCLLSCIYSLVFDDVTLVYSVTANDPSAQLSQ